MLSELHWAELTSELSSDQSERMYAWPPSSSPETSGAPGQSDSLGRIGQGLMKSQEKKVEAMHIFPQLTKKKQVSQEFEREMHLILYVKRKLYPVSL